jgi:hypothetical protein
MRALAVQTQESASWDDETPPYAGGCALYLRVGCAVCGRKGRIHVYERRAGASAQGRQVACPLCRGRGWRHEQLQPSYNSGGGDNLPGGALTGRAVADTPARNTSPRMPGAARPSAATRTRG